MTTDEAFKILEEIEILDDSMYQYNIKYLEALEMAIKALKQYGAFQEIRQEINKAIDCIPITLSRNDADDCLKRDIKDIFDKHIREIEGSDTE